ncbi:hypothetical protein TRFO_31493 [Tritrichomonas foetus]|uniref:UBA domain-containing protein n=1 Tax=Tritrichomonas foetus TaxID=1144522 RepID=A0A1J4JR64_9EUKA|nr:hypothetical protein TRFO_31493 [Tritrichomonas foetus]|eukprot:OHT01655.1 hypothetical protein TRFO_31493 [Tritrichomonas foetus]
MILPNQNVGCICQSLSDDEYDVDKKVNTNLHISIKIHLQSKSQEAFHTKPLVVDLPKRRSTRSLESNIAALMEYGFHRSDCEIALHRSHNNLDRALDYLADPSQAQKFVPSRTQNDIDTENKVSLLKNETKMQDEIIIHQVLKLNNDSYELSKETLLTMI